LVDKINDKTKTKDDFLWMGSLLYIPFSWLQERHPACKKPRCQLSQKVLFQKRMKKKIKVPVGCFIWKNAGSPGKPRRLAWKIVIP